MEIAEFFRANGRIFEVEPEKSIVSRGGKATDVHLVLTGRVLLHSSSPLGHEFVYDIIKPGELFGLAAILKQADARLDAAALVRSRLAAIDSVELERAMLSQPALAVHVLKHCVHFLKKRSAQLSDFALLSFPGRLAKWFMYFTDEQGIDFHVGATFECDYPKSLIAQMIGVSRETVSRQIQKWEEAGMVTQTGKTICILDPNRLRLIADGHLTGWD
jgi:CRP/FNR family transcriptional regulator, cyclic AMP receptor protein